MSDIDATPARQDVVAEIDEIIEHVINGNMLSMPYDVYLELFDAVDGLGVEIEKLQSENTKLREQVASFIELSQDMVIYAGQNMKRHFAKRLRKLGVPL